MLLRFQKLAQDSGLLLQAATRASPSRVLDTRLGHLALDGKHVSSLLAAAGAKPRVHHSMHAILERVSEHVMPSPTISFGQAASPGSAKTETRLLPYDGIFAAGLADFFLAEWGAKARCICPTHNCPACHDERNLEASHGHQKF